MLWLLTLPFRIVFGLLAGLLLLPVAILVFPLALLAIPFLIVRFALKLAVGLLVMPFVLVMVAAGLGLALVALVVAIVTPLLPFAFAAFCVWLILGLGPRSRFA